MCLVFPAASLDVDLFGDRNSKDLWSLKLLSSEKEDDVKSSVGFFYGV